MTDCTWLQLCRAMLHMPCQVRTHHHMNDGAGAALCTCRCAEALRKHSAHQ